MHQYMTYNDMKYIMYRLNTRLTWINDVHEVHGTQSVIASYGIAGNVCGIPGTCCCINLLTERQGAPEHGLLVRHGGLLRAMASCCRRSHGVAVCGPYQVGLWQGPNDRSCMHQCHRLTADYDGCLLIDKIACLLGPSFHHSLSGP
jgi:hypothetical protein